MSCGVEIFDVQHFETQKTLLLIETYHLIHQNWKDKEKEDDIFICYIQRHCATYKYFWSYTVGVKSHVIDRRSWNRFLGAHKRLYKKLIIFNVAHAKSEKIALYFTKELEEGKKILVYLHSCFA